MNTQGVNGVNSSNTNFCSIKLPKDAGLFELVKNSKFKYKVVSICNSFEDTRKYINSPEHNKIRMEMGNSIPDVAIMRGRSNYAQDSLVGRNLDVETDLYHNEILPKYPDAEWIKDI
ncbi:MAG: hypothetical protein R3Y28_07725 [Candidatus Gastranaerophilales bacterium]